MTGDSRGQDRLCFSILPIYFSGDGLAAEGVAWAPGDRSRPFTRPLHPPASDRTQPLVTGKPTRHGSRS